MRIRIEFELYDGDVAHPDDPNGERFPIVDESDETGMSEAAFLKLSLDLGEWGEDVEIRRADS